MNQGWGWEARAEGPGLRLGYIPTQAQDNILDVCHQQVDSVTIDILWCIRGAVSTQVHSHHMEAALELPELVTPGEPVGQAEEGGKLSQGPQAAPPPNAQ